ncbi:MAG: DUF4349 domain-containing protein [Chloroflexota bacterium]
MNSRVPSSLLGRMAQKGGKTGKRIGLLVLTLVVIAGLVGVAMQLGQAAISTASGVPQTESRSYLEKPADSVGGGSTAETPSGEPGTGATKDGTTKAWDRMVIRTASLQLTVKDVGASVDRIRSLAGQHGGYVFSSESRQEGDYTYSTVTIQVPSAEFDQIMPTLRNMEGLVVKVSNENVTSTDVTEEFTDLQSQLRNLQATEARMLALQAKAENMDDILAIDRELRAVQGEIEQIQGRTNYISKRAEMSTITIQLSPQFAPAIEPPVSEPAWQPFEAAVKAWNASLDMLAGLGTAVITYAVFLWWLAPLMLVSLFFLRRGRERASPVLAGAAGDTQLGQVS